MRFRAPASSANLGPGFDTLAVALALYADVEVLAADEFRMRTHGEGAHLPTDRSHLAARVAIEAAGHDCLSIRVRSQIPLARGLGSSAAIAAAAAAAAGAKNPLAVAAAFDGHPENAAAAVTGGLVSATLIDGRTGVARHPLDAELAFVVLVPDARLSTGQARQAVPNDVSLADAVFNLGRMGLLLAGLADHKVLRPEATDDRLHQAARQAMFPESAVLLESLMDAGALAVCWSGAGPSILGLCVKSSGNDLRAAGEAVLEQAGVEGRVLLVEPDHGGLTPMPASS